MTILDEILARKRDEIRAARAEVCDEDMSARAEAGPRPRGFRRALEAGAAPRVIAEVKRRSPSKGEIRPDFDPVACGKAYSEAGAAAISVLTDEHFFGGRLDYLGAIRAAADVPLLRKDFLVDAYQVDEARAAGADAILLIVAALEPERLRELQERASALDLDVLVEVHDEAELDVALASGAELVGVNNRDLRTFEVDLATTERLAASIPEDVLLVAESGIHEHGDIVRLERAGAGAVLVGESLMRQPDLGSALRRLRGRP
jgi:indole-3-glycerol phosphate synthase